VNPSQPVDHSPHPGMPGKAPHLGVNVFWTLAGYAAFMVCQWAMLVVVARLGTPENVGEFALGLTLSAPVILFANLGLRRFQVADASGRFRFADYFGLRILMAGVALAGIAAIAAGSGYGPGVAGAILAMGVAKAVESANDVVLGALQKGERMDLVARSMALRGVAGTAALALGMATTRSVALSILMMAAAWAAVSAFHDLPRAARVEPQGIRPRWSAPVLARLARLSLPLGIVTTIVSLMATVPSVLIERFLGAAELGVYSALACAWAASHRIASAMGEAASARLARHVAEGRRSSFVRVTAGLLALAAGVAAAGLAVAAFAGRPLLGFLYGPTYAARADLLTGFMLASVAGNLAIVLDYGMTALGRLKTQSAIQAAALGVFGALCVRLIPSHGLAGAVLALGIVSAIQGACASVVVAHALLTFPPARDGVAWGRA
jgi:O-antigen/teichoic acid export membrane protein